MQNIPFHIAFLLTQHACVIVPGLGAFVVSPVDKGERNRWGILSPPEFILKFDPGIKHNDGLLANSISNEKKCPVSEANQLIEKYVNFLFTTINEGGKAKIPWVGCLFKDDNESFFQPERTLSCNASNYGLSGFSMPSVNDLHQQPDTSVKKKKKKKKFLWFSFGR